MIGRRELLLAGLALPTLEASIEGGSAPVGRPRRPDGRSLPTRIAFGSCAHEEKRQPIWDAVLEARPDVFIFLGDNVYGDTRDPSVLRAKYAKLQDKPEFQRLCAQVPILATWDDHDYGENDAGRDYPMKEESRGIFCDFWGEPSSSVRRTREGIFDAITFVSEGRRLQVILPDLRFNRTPIRSLELAGTRYDDWAKQVERDGREVPGPYERNPDMSATMLGETQWQWLEEQLAEPADLRILASSLQVVADFPGWEAWINYTGDHQRLLQAIRKHRADGLICISGDTHYAEISRLDLNTPYPLWDFTSSGLTEVWPVTPPNSRRVGSVLREKNFGLITVDWLSPRTSILVQAIDVSGVPRLEQRISLDTLRVS